MNIDDSLSRFLPLAGAFAVFALASCWRPWLQHRRHGHWGIVLFRSGSGAQHLRDAMLVVLFVLLLGQAVVAAAWPDLVPASRGPLAAAGTALLSGGIGLLVAAQLHLGASWRIGIDESARPGLVTGGLYRWIRNPIYLALLVILTGYALLLPSALSLILLAGAFIGIRRQVAAEERYLAQKYGEAFREYACRVPRFVPGGGKVSGVVVLGIVALALYCGYRVATIGTAYVAKILCSGGLQAAGLPNEIHILVPVTAGSSLDARARVIADAIGQRIKHRVIVENRPGAGGTIGALAVARSKPDGSTLLFTNNSHVVSPYVYADPGYDPIKDFAPIAQAYVSGMVLVAHPSLQVASLKELVALARGQTQPPSYASSGTGGMPHLAMELFKQVAGIDLLHIPYRGDGQALTDVLAGRVPVMMSGYVVATPHIRAGKLRALAVTSPARAEVLPGVPTIAESGYPTYVLDTWTGFFAPAGAPAEVIHKLHHEIAAALATPAVQAQLAATGAEAAVTSPAEFATFVRQEWELYGKLVRKLKLTVE